MRIGYVSGDFRHHVVSYWTKHILAGHNRKNVEVFCFANNKEDDYSRQVKDSSDHWISILDRSDAEAGPASFRKPGSTFWWTYRVTPEATAYV